MDRKKVFGIFGGFLAVMLVFTILSRAVSGASMARVETVKAKAGVIEHKVSGSGKVEAGKEIAVYTENGQRVKEICVEEGQTVEKGDLLFTVDLEELEEQILALQQELEKARLQNQDVESARNLEQKNWETNRNRAAEDYNQAVANGEQAVSQAKAAWDQAEQELHTFLQNQSAALSSAEPQRADSNPTDESQENSDGENNAKEDPPDGNQKEDSDQSQNQGQAAGQGENAAQAKAEWEAQKAQLAQAAAEAKAAYEAALSARAENVKTTARALEDASRQPASDSTSKQNEITRQQQELALSKLQSLKETEGKITAPVQGIVTQISITTGDFTTEGTAIRLADTSQGNRLTASVDKSNEKYISKGSPVNISVSGKKEEISDYTVTNVTENEEDPNLLDVVIDLPQGVLEAGMMADIEVVQKSEEYGSVIPVQALHEEQNGTYILVLQEEQGVMGTELTAKRLEVNVLDKNSTYAALEEGLLSSDQEIISSSSRAVEEGSRVRRKEA